MEEYLTVRGTSEGELEEKRSRFIAHIRRVSSEEEAQEYIAAVKKQYWDAKHNCFAYIVNTDTLPIERSGDDGEPSRTAGLPMLEVLRGAGLKNVVAVVTRYFGGILLGTGGLVRAYQGAIKDAVSHADIVRVKEMMKIMIISPYDCYNSVEYYISQQGLTTDGSVFTDKVETTVYTDIQDADRISAKLSDISGGRCEINTMGTDWVEVPETFS